MNVINFPTRKNERYKYADFSLIAQKEFVPAKRIVDEQILDTIHQQRLQRGESILLIFINGYFMPAISDLAKLPKNIIACSLNAAFHQHGDLMQRESFKIDEEKYPFASFNTLNQTDGLFFYLPDNCELITPIHLLFLSIDENDFITHPKHLFLLGKNSKVTIAEEYFSHIPQMYMQNSVTSISLQEHAELNHYKIQQEGQCAVHIAHTFIQQRENSKASFTNFSLGSQFARDDLIVCLKEQGAECKSAGFYHLRHDHQYIDQHIEIEHSAPFSHSEMLYKGIIGPKARAVFNGRLLVEKNAQKISAYQANHNLLLSNDAEVYTKPELEIYADDVKCKHGATTGQLDQDALFYLRARGISKTEATDILLQGFAEEIVERIQHPGIKMRVLEVMS